MIAFSQTNAAGTQIGSYNLSCSKGATGIYTYTFGVARADTNYVVIGDIEDIDTVNHKYIFQYETSSHTTAGFTFTVAEYTSPFMANVDVSHAIRIYAERT